MKLKIYSVFDAAVKAYLQPFYARSHAEAVRMFSEAANDGKSNFGKHVADYEMYYLGEYDDLAGLFESRSPVRIISARECVEDRPVN
ncbi:MAG: nonstructural protein [Microvirus sp.]|nr:MAG: nonstructural protein [Microvirus sp.]